MNYKVIAFVLFSALLAGCGDDGQQAELTRSVDWYKEHKTERDAKIAECKNNPGELELTPNCINARKAATDTAFKARGNPKLVPLTADEINKRK